MTQIEMPDLIQAMLQPAFYPHPVTSIQLIQTHVSYVFLTGDYAYKVKKPVNFGFLNFSTLAARQHFCLEEIQMNRQIAPEIYLDVLPITQADDHSFALNGTGQTVEYVLKMREFPQEDLFLSLFEQGKLTEAHMEELGKIVAQFHAKAQTNDYIRSFGEVAQVRQAIDENYQQTDQYIGTAQTKQQFDETKQFTDTFFDQQQELFNSRIKNNKIRECHGDLHLRNICLWENQIQLFDRIEFNEPFRFVDVMYDVAFAVMDLEARQRKDLGNAFLNTYVEQTGDWEGLQVLPLYLSRQAYVRAKVTSFLLNDPSVPADVKKEAMATATDYYKLAWNYTQKRQGRLILMSGLSGSGKTTVARYLARQLGAIHLRSDAVRKHLAGIALTEKGGAELYTAEMNQKTYDRLLELGIKLANLGWIVILDAKYDREAVRQNAIAQSQNHHLPIEIIHCTAPENILRDRLTSRTNDVSDATADLLEQQKAIAQPFTEVEKRLLKTLDTSQDWAAQLL
jgi:uncharacterized protein